MEKFSESQLDRLWTEYSQVFRDYDDLTLARWMSQTLGQLQGKCWRVSHPLVGAYRLAAHWAQERQIWLKRLASIPGDYASTACCRSPLLPLLTRDVLESGLICQHCSSTVVPLDEIPSPLREDLRRWAEEYAAVHAVAHWDETQRRTTTNYEQSLDEAADSAERLLTHLGSQIAPQLLEHYSAIVWEDQDECLEVRPEDIQL
jgi:hypothetical protein